MLGLSLAVLCLDFNYQTAESEVKRNDKFIVKTFVSTAQSESGLQDSGGVDGLYRIDDQLYNIINRVHQHDTLFVTFQNNESAWQHFTVLSEIMQEVYSANKTSHPVSLAIRLLTDFSKVYLSTNAFTLNNHMCIIQWLKPILFDDLQHSLKQEVLLPDSPPPENSLVTCSEGFNAKIFFGS
ncbi:hypothetical protein Dfri01_50060 [Dyadobacter frigoris]|nr:hypothetical protein Dfri01_50060 [Dyadobacter frigoris]